MIYVLIFSNDDGTTWDVVDASDDRDAIFSACATLQQTQPFTRFEVKCLDAHLWNALQPVSTP